MPQITLSKLFFYKCQRFIFPNFVDYNLFNEDQAKLNINFRRGSNKSGFRNKNEMINISVSNIPSGYKLVEKINDEFRSVGATDKFGTLSLFSIPNLQNPVLINDYQSLNRPLHLWD